MVVSVGDGGEGMNTWTIAGIWGTLWDTAVMAVHHRMYTAEESSESDHDVG